MGERQMEMFPPATPTPDQRLNAWQARMRRDLALRDATREPSQYERRRRARHAVRASTLRFSRGQLELGRALYPEEEHADVQRPRVRADCAGVPRPCPFVSCRHHLYLDVSARTGSIKLNFPDLEPGELPPNRSCALDVAEEAEGGGLTLEAIGAAINLTHEAAHQVERTALEHAKRRLRVFYAREFGERGCTGNGARETSSKDSP